MRANHDRESEIWVKIHKKSPVLPTVTHAEALDMALCWGWIDGIRKGLDEQSFLQRFTPRRAKSIWSQVNQRHIARLTTAGRMTEHGQRHVDAAKADGRWDAAYAPIRKTPARPVSPTTYARRSMRTRAHERRSRRSGDRTSSRWRFARTT